MVYRKMIVWVAEDGDETRHDVAKRLGDAIHDNDHGVEVEIIATDDRLIIVSYNRRFKSSQSHNKGAKYIKC